MFITRNISNKSKTNISLSNFYRSFGSSGSLLKTKTSDEIWTNAASNISWSKPYKELVDISNLPFTKWFRGGEMNTCYNSIDKHILDGYGKQLAIIYSSPVTGVTDTLSYEMLHEEVCKFAYVLQKKGVNKGDRVVIYMPNSPQAIIAMLACARLGAVHCVVFGGFAANELTIRIRDCKPSVLICTSCGIEGSKVINYKAIVDQSISDASSTHVVDTCIVYQRPQLTAPLTEGCDVAWDDEMSQVPTSVVSDNLIPCVPVESSDPLYVLYTSGTTGQPKGVVRDNGGHAVAVKWAMEKIFGMFPGDVWWATADVGWVVGHSFAVYGPLLNRCTTLIYEGKPVGTPHAGIFWELIERYKVKGIFTAPTALRAIKMMDPEGEYIKKYDISTLQMMFLAGERSDPASLQWAEEKLRVPIRDNWWQTETGWPICGNMVEIEGYLPIKYGSSFRPCVGYDLRVFDYEENIELVTGENGRLAVKLPMPPGFMQTIHDNDDRFVESYMSSIPGYYDTGDAGYIDEDGYVHVMTRTDDVINVSGHRLSTGSMEEV